LDLVTLDHRLIADGVPLPPGNGEFSPVIQGGARRTSAPSVLLCLLFPNARLLIIQLECELHVFCKVN
jgi:hypothetical protein